MRVERLLPRCRLFGCFGWAEGRRKKLGRTRTVEAQLCVRRPDVAHLDVLAEDEIREALPDRLGRAPRKVDQDFRAELAYPHVADHAPLRGQERGVAPFSGPQGLDIVGEQAVQVAQAVGAGELESAAGAPIKQPRARPQSVGTVRVQTWDALIS